MCLTDETSRTLFFICNPRDPSALFVTRHPDGQLSLVAFRRAALAVGYALSHGPATETVLLMELPEADLPELFGALRKESVNHLWVVDENRLEEIGEAA